MCRTGDCNPRAKELGAWVVMGFPEERAETYQAGKTKVTSCFGQLNLCSIESEYSSEENDLLAIDLAGSAHENGLKSYEGISGGGVWHVIVESDGSKLKILKVLLKGVVFFQLEDSGEERAVVAHGPTSTYDFIRKFGNA